MLDGRSCEWRATSGCGDSVNLARTLTLVVTHFWQVPCSPMLYTLVSLSLTLDTSLVSGIIMRATAESFLCLHHTYYELRIPFSHQQF